MNTNELCMGCMGEKGAARICQSCGWQEGTLGSSALQLPPRSVIAKRYLLGRVVGQGGFGITYVGWDMVNSRKVAVKEFMPQAVATRAPGSSMVTPSSQNSRADFDYGLDRFSEEARILMLFREHPCIVSFLDFQQANGTAYMIMELLEGMTLIDYLHAHNERMPCEQALPIIMLVLDGLREVHSHGLLHRDVSPDNIFLTRSRAVKLIDFGASRVAMGERSQNLSVILKPGYAPAEQYQQRGRQGPATDIYATAATFYRAITGHIPPVALERQIEDTLKMPSRLGIQVPPNIEAALRRALAIQMKDRFARVEELQEAFRGSAPVNVGPVQDHQEATGIPPAPSPILVYLVGIVCSLLLWMVGQRAVTTTQARDTLAPVTDAPSISAPSTTAASARPSGAGPEVSDVELTAAIAGQQVTADLSFRIDPFQGKTGCALVAFVNSDGKYLESGPSHMFQMIQQFSPERDQSPVRLRFARPLSQLVLESGHHEVSVVGFLFAHECSVRDDPVIYKSSLVPVALDVP